MANSFKAAAGAVGLILMMAAASPAAAQGPVVLGGDAADCRPGAAGTSALVTVHGFKNRDGRLRIQNYTGTKGEYLESGKYLRRQEIAMTADGDMTVCLALPGPGRYVIVALHDTNSDGKLSVWSDGIGFSNNPKLGLAKPPADKTLFTATPGVNNVRIVMNYLRGLSVSPLKGVS
ncbi:DUF2141 domain-containing protein [Sandarakinorhabdus sp. DWP1-3-1]|uniref:DUF2141 domain-containing protein n=1 Tax=Sandarakinorhabdus sp. DWP1-3-1 TaxID=2804627 RepID=UPI003CED919A